MIDRRTFCTDFDLAPARVSDVLDAPGRETAPDKTSSGWLVDAVLAVAAWITAIGLFAFFGVAFEMLLRLQEPTLVHAGLGAAVFTAGLIFCRDPATGIYQAQLGIALAAAGAALWMAGIAVPRDSLIVAALAALVPAALVIAAAAPRGLQLLTSALFVGLGVVAIWDARLAQGADLLAFATVAGAGLLTFPPRYDLRPTAVVLLLTVPVAALLPDILGRLDADGWGARIIHAALVAALVREWTRRGTADRASMLAPALAAAVALLLPAGGSAAMALLALAAILGSWPLAAIGSVTQVVFLWRFYADLQFDLLTKSGMLVAVGLLLIAVWVWLDRREGRA